MTNPDPMGYEYDLAEIYSAIILLEEAKTLHSRCISKRSEKNDTADMQAVLYETLAAERIMRAITTLELIQISLLTKSSRLAEEIVEDIELDQIKDEPVCGDKK